MSLRKGHHESLISFETFQRVQNRLKTGAKAPARKDINEDFPLRGFVLCADCSKPLTACWSKSKTGKRHPYYLCPTKGCPSYRKSIRRADLEGDFDDLVRTLEPSQELVTIAEDMFRSAWSQRAAQAKSHLAHLKTEAGKIDRQIGQFLDRVEGV